MGNVCIISTGQVIIVAGALFFSVWLGFFFFFLDIRYIQNCIEVILKYQTSEAGESSCRVLSLLITRVKGWYQEFIFTFFFFFFLLFPLEF